MDEQKPNPSGLACNLIINAVFAYFFYKYAFQNPDEGSCFAKEGNETAYGEIPMITTGSGEEATQTPEEGFTDVSKKFQTWFMYGLILNVIGMVQSIVGFLAVSLESSSVGKLGALFGCVQGCGSLAWLIAGAIFRWGFAGKVCSGDYVVNGDINKVPFAHSTGKFMKYYLMIVLGVMGVGICCGLIVGTTMGMTAARS